MGIKQWLRAAATGRWIYALVSLVLLAPCYWQPRLQAGDLSSHIYNAWLAQLIESGRADGVVSSPLPVGCYVEILAARSMRLWVRTFRRISFFWLTLAISQDCQ